MYMVAGLGNPGRQYEGTRHNCGFEALDVLMKKYSVTLTETKCQAFYGKCMIEGQKTLLVKPQTYMNLSGTAIQGLTDFYKIDTANELIVICDDINLAPGLLRVRPKGSTLYVSALAWVKSLQAGIWPIMCSDIFPLKMRSLWKRADRELPRLSR